jgi:hypothetical protein
MLNLFLFAASMLTPEAPRELRVGDVIELKAPRVLATPQSPEPVPVVVVAPVVAYGDQYGFSEWLNATRARHGLHALVHDAGLSALAAANSSRGFGHHGFNPGRENVGMGSLQTVESMWMRSPAHASAILDRGARYYGIAHVNGVWTYNAR